MTHKKIQAVEPIVCRVRPRRHFLSVLNRSTKTLTVTPRHRQGTHLRVARRRPLCVESQASRRLTKIF